MQYNIDTGIFQVVLESADINAVVGESARIEVGEAINYIKTGQTEIGEAVQEGIASFDSNAGEKTSEFNSNAQDKTGDFNDNAVDKTNDFNDNATAKTGDFNDNASDKTSDFNLNAQNKTSDFNDNYTEKKGLIDAQVVIAEGAATTATNQAGLAKQWAIGDPSEPTGNSAKYWAEQASNALRGLTSRVSTIEDKIPSDASSSNQLADKNWVENKGYITGINSGDVTAALGYTPYNSSNPDGYQTASDVATAISGKQDILVSGTNIKTINGSSVLGSGDLSVTAQIVWGSITGTLSNQADLQNALNTKQGTLTFDSTPTSGSSNPVTSGGIYTALSAKANDSDVVKLTGDQNIAGIKTFTGNFVVENVSPLLIARSTKTTRGAYNSSQGENKVVFRDKDNKLLSEMRTYVESSDSATSLCLGVVTEDTNGNQLYRTVFRGTIHKNGTSEVQLGSDAIYGVTPATSDNSTKMATTAFIVNVLKAVYPVGSCFIGTTSTCPLASFFGTWTLKSTGIVTSVDSNVPVKGNGKALGLTDGSTDYSLGNDTGTINGRHTCLYKIFSNSSLPATSSNATISTNNALFGVNTDDTKSGIVGTVTRSTLSVNIWERTA